MADRSPTFKCHLTKFVTCYGQSANFFQQVIAYKGLLREEDKKYVCRIGVDSLECLQSLYEPCLKQYSRLYFMKSLIKRTKKYVEKLCTKDFKKAPPLQVFQNCIDAVKEDLRRCSDMYNISMEYNANRFENNTEFGTAKQCCVQREFERCVHRINKSECRKEGVNYLKNQAINDTLINGYQVLCNKQIGLNWFCNNDELTDEDVRDSSSETSTLRELIYINGAYVSPLLLVIIFVYYIAMKVKCSAEERPAKPEPFYDEVLDTIVERRL